MTLSGRETRSVRQVRKRDGRLVEFDESKIADAIYKAALSVGGEDRFLAEELAAVVTLFLEKTWPGTVPSIEDVQDMVEKVLIETGHARTAKSYILYRERRAKQREAESLPHRPAQKSLFEPGPVAVLDATEERIRPLDADRLAAWISAETELSPEMAGSVADAVSERARTLDRDSVSATLLSRLVDAELLARGYARAVERRRTISLSRETIERALFPKEGERTGSPRERAAEALLRRFSLDEIYPAEVSAAHLEGRIDLSGLTNPTAMFSAAISPDAIRIFGIPGLGGRFRPEAVGSARRFAAWLGRAIRAISPHVTHGLSLPRLNLLLAPLLVSLDYESMKEEAWHLLSELAGVPGLEIELAAGSPPILAARKARGPDGETLAEDYSRFTGTATQMALAFLEVRGNGTGLGQRCELPRLVVTLGAESLGGSAEGLLTRAVGEALAREPVLFVLDREDLPLLGTSTARIKLEDATRLTDTATLSAAVSDRVVLNLPRAALRAGRDDVARFLGEVEAVTALAVEGSRARRLFLARAGAGADGPLSPLTRPRGGAPAIVDLEAATSSIAVTGLNEAVLLVLGEELHESDEARRLGQRALARVRGVVDGMRGSSFTADVDAAEDRRPAERFGCRDREDYPEATESVFRYTPGIALREDAPVDLALRLETESRLGMAIRTSTVRCVLGEREHPASETLVALIRKTFFNTRIRQIVLGRTV